MKASAWSERILCLVILAVLFLAAPVFAQDSVADSKVEAESPGLSGIWRVKIALPGGEKPAGASEDHHTMILTLDDNGAQDKATIYVPGESEFTFDELKVTDVLLQDDALQVYFDYSLVKGDPENSVELKGKLDEKGHFAGTWQLLVTAQSGKWTATKGGGGGGRGGADPAVASVDKKDEEEVAAAAPSADTEDEEEATGIGAKIDSLFGTYVVGPIGAVLMWKIGGQVPLIVAWLFLGALYFTLRMKFVNFRLFGHAIALVRGKYDEPDSVGEVTHFQALATALSATVGLGNIAGVAIAIGLGGPGATLWMILIGLLGMTAKFTECTLGQKYRQVRSDGKIMGGAMYYLSDGLKEIGFKRLGGFLAVFFCILCIGGSLGGGNTFQVVQSLSVIQESVPLLEDYPWVYGMIMTLLGGVVIIGGIRSISRVAEKIVPLMCGIYVTACVVILAMNIPAIPDAISKIIDGAFTPDAAYGGFIGVLVIGLKRAVFSNEAGIGSAAIAHSAAKVKHPVEEGVVALLEPFIDTVIVCTMTALVIIITKAYDTKNFIHDELSSAQVQAFIDGDEGGALTSAAMGSQIPWFPMILAVAVFLFAFSTMISWSYYGERCWVWMFGDGSSMVYRVIFLVFTFLGSIINATNIKDFSDFMVLGMAFPNILGVLLLSGIVARDLKEYTGMLKRGELEPGYSASGKEEDAGEEAGADEAGKAEDEAPEA